MRVGVVTSGRGRWAEQLQMGRNVTQTGMKGVYETRQWGSVQQQRKGRVCVCGATVMVWVGVASNPPVGV